MDFQSKYLVVTIPEGSAEPSYSQGFDNFAKAAEAYKEQSKGDIKATVVIYGRMAMIQTDPEAASILRIYQDILR